MSREDNPHFPFTGETVGRSRVIESSDEAWLAFVAIPHAERGCCPPAVSHDAEQESPEG